MSPHPRPGPSAPDRVADLIRHTLHRRRTDSVSLAELADALSVGQPLLRAAAARHPDLGIADAGPSPLLWTLPPDVLAAGFRPVVRAGELVLRSPLEPGQTPLIIAGRHLGPGPDDPPLPGGGRGALGHTVHRLSVLAQRWLVLPPRQATGGGRTQRLFELIAHTWRLSPDPIWVDGALHIHQGEHAGPVAIQLCAGGGTTNRLELVVYHRDRRPELVNVYPAGTHRTIFRIGD